VARMTIAALTLSLIVAASVTAQPDESIQLGAVTLRLGRPKAEVSAQLAALYSVQPLKGGGSLAITTKDGPPYTSIGIVSFDARERLSYVSRLWGPINQEAAVPTGEAIFSALRQVAAPSGDGQWSCACNVEISEGRSPEGSQQMIRITNATNRAVWIGVTTFRQGKLDVSGLSVSEVLKR